jgi:hypothetical protein
MVTGTRHGFWRISMLLTMPAMPHLQWRVTVKPWTWIYTFSDTGTVSWLDPFNKMTGKGTWRIVGDTMTTRWVNSKTWEEWDVPFNPQGTDGTCHMAGNDDRQLHAVALNFHLQPGDVVYKGAPIQNSGGIVASIIYPDEVRSGGTIAWICKNPGNIRDGDKFGAYKGKKLHVGKAGAFAIFPDETTGLMAVVGVLRGYGRVTLSQAMQKYAPRTDGHNDPDKYASILSSGMRLSINTYLPSLSDEQMLRLAYLITGVERTAPGRTFSWDDPDLPGEIRQRLGGTT